jgi:hypothetical protein
MNTHTKKNKKLKTTKDIVSAIQSEISKINEIKTLKNKNFELSEQIILNFKFPSNKFVYNFQGISNFYHFHICYNSRAVRENKISIVSSVFTNDLETFSFPYRIVKKDRNEKMKDGFDDITNDFELKLDESTLSFLERKFRNIENFTASRSQQQINSTTQNQVNVQDNVNGSQYNIEVIEDKMEVENSVPQLRNNNNTVQNTSNIYNYSPIDCNNNDKMKVDLFY